MSLMDETASDIPVKDTDCKPTVLSAIQDVVTGSNPPQMLLQKSAKMKEKDLKARRRVALIPREELEDNFLRLHEENLILKDYARKQEDKLKRMATKLLRLTSDLGHGEKKIRKDGRDLDAEDTIENLQDRVRDLERRNEALRQRLTTYKQRLQLQDGCRHCPYGAISARINSGIRKTTTLPDKYRKGLRVQGPDTGPLQVTAELCGESLSDEARAEIERLFQIISRQNCNMDDKVAVILKHMGTAKPKDVETEMLLSMQHMQQAEEQRTIIQENIRNIRLQKEIREKNTSLCALREQFQQLKESYETELEEKQKSLTLSHKHVLMQLEDLSTQLKEERSKVVSLEVDQQNMANLQTSLLEYQQRVVELEREKDLLKEHHENLLKSSMDLERMNSWKMTDVEFKAQITKLEQHVQHYESDLKHSKEQLHHEREQSEHLKHAVSKLQCQLLEKMQEIQDLQDKISVLSSSSSAREASYEQEMTVQKPQIHIPEDYWILKKMFHEKEDLNNTYKEEKRKPEREERSETEAETEKKKKYEDLRMKIEEEERRKLEPETKRKLLDMDAAHAETILELEKTREMLILQHQINQDYQEEVKSVKLRAECESREREEREHHYEARLRKRSSRIQTLEAQLKDIAYGTTPYRLDEDSPSPDGSTSPPPSLQRGETLFEIHIGGICLSAHGIRVVNDPQPVTFCIYSLYDFETHATPVVPGMMPQYNFTSCYAVTPDPKFLSYLRVGTLTVELYQVRGGEHCELARGRIRLETALQSTDRVHSTITMTDANGENMGELKYWLRLHGPLSQAQCLQRQKSKAKVYLSSGRNSGIGKAWTSQLSNRNQNALLIHVWGCRSLKTSTLGHQPSPYIVYRFYHHPDHSTSIIPCSNNPQFSDEAVYPVPLTVDLERYLRQECLHIYVFDDEETQPGGYLGKAEVPLQSLALGSSIQGDFALVNPSGKCTGSVQLSLEWKVPYPPQEKSGPIVQRKHPKVLFAEKKSNEKELSKEDLRRSGLTKSCKAEEDLHRDVSSHKRGKRDGHITDVHQQDMKQDVSEHYMDEMDVQDNEVGQEESQEQVDQLIYEDVKESDHETVSGHSDNFLSERDEKTLSGPHVQHNGNDDEDIIIVGKPLVPFKLPSSWIRVEIVSLTLDPSSEVVADEAVERVFVEFQFDGVPAEETETPLSLRKPSQGEEIYYHFSKVIYLDDIEHADRRNFLYMLLEGSDTKGKKIRLKFTVVSDPVDEANDECRDIGYSYLDLRHLLRRSVDPAEETLQIMDISDPRQIIGSLHVKIEAREAARAIYREKRSIRPSSPFIQVN